MTVTALLGPNGAGKTTRLRAMAAAATERVGLMYQDHLLFPHMSVLDNVAFGPRSQGASKAASRGVARDWLARVGMAGFADAKPRTLSGGEAQLVALARALASDPQLLLLDEPLAALDVGTRVAIRRELRRFLSDFAGPVFIVTHDPVDAWVLAERVMVIEHHEVTQEGTLAEITARPATRYVADLAGTNLVRGVARATTLTTDGGTELVLAEPIDGPVLATIAPEAITLSRDEPKSSARNSWLLTVSHIDPIGPRVRVQFGDPLPLVAEITAASASELGVEEGARVWASVKATEIVTYPA